jgi:hypothetical protein
MALGEYYTVLEDVWAAAFRKSYDECIDDGMLCIACLERRLGRELMRHDFEPRAMINYLDVFNPRSERLKDRVMRMTYG